MRVRSRPVWWLLALVLVAAQALGLMHRIVHGAHAEASHGGTASHAHEHAHDDSHDDGHGDAHGHGSVIASLFSGHDDDRSCRLFDPLNHDALPSLPVLLLPLVIAPFVALLQQGEFVARWAAMFDARGPPALR